LPVSNCSAQAKQYIQKPDKTPSSKQRTMNNIDSLAPQNACRTEDTTNKITRKNIYTRNKSKKFQIISNFVKMSNHFVLK